MTRTTEAAIELPPVDEGGRPRGFTTAGKRKAAIWAVVIVGVAIFFLATAVSGPAGDTRIENPHPHGSVIVDGVPRAERPFLGVENWPLVFSLLFVVFATAVLIPMLVRSVRRRQMTHGLIIFLSVAVLAWLDPPANWVTFTVYDPRFLHFPTDWPWMRLSPSVEPLMVVPGYPFYYFILALVAFGGFQRFVFPRLRVGGWLRRHPRTSLFATVFVVATIWDFATEMFMIRAGCTSTRRAGDPRCTGVRRTRGSRSSGDSSRPCRSPRSASCSTGTTTAAPR